MVILICCFSLLCLLCQNGKGCKPHNSCAHQQRLDYRWLNHSSYQFIINAGTIQSWKLTKAEGPDLPHTLLELYPGLYSCLPWSLYFRWVIMPSSVLLRKAVLNQAQNLIVEFYGNKGGPGQMKYNIALLSLWLWFGNCFLYHILIIIWDQLFVYTYQMLYYI